MNLHFLLVFLCAFVYDLNILDVKTKFKRNLFSYVSDELKARSEETKSKIREFLGKKIPDPILDFFDRPITAVSNILLKTLAASLSEETETIEDVYEPYLLQLGFIVRTPKGRVASDLSFAHLGLEKE